MTAKATLITAAKNLRTELASCTFAAPVSLVYQPLDYAWAVHQRYLKQYGSGHKRVLFLGMNPGPYGMVQTGVPFGEIAAVRDWMGLEAPVNQPQEQHPKRPIEGFGCTRSEVSGRRLWGYFAERYPNPVDFFAEHFVVNYCPLAFLGDTGRNITPDKLQADERAAIAAPCDRHLLATLEATKPEWCIGVGAYARQCFERVLGRKAGKTCESGPQIGQILHPSPASPAANRGWAEAAYQQLLDLQVWSA